MAAARFMTGIQSGSVMEITSNELSLKRQTSTVDYNLQTKPAAMASPMLKPVTSFLPFFFRV
jgi:hypothetical protein